MKINLKIYQKELSDIMTVYLGAKVSISYFITKKIFIINLPGYTENGTPIHVSELKVKYKKLKKAISTVGVKWIHFDNYIGTYEEILKLKDEIDILIIEEDLKNFNL